MLTSEQDAWLRAHAAGRIVKDLTEMLNVEFSTSFNTNQIHNYMTNHKIRNGMWRTTNYEHKKLFTEEEHAYLLSINNMKHAQEVADLFNAKYPGKDITTSQIKGWRARYHLNCGLDGRFQKGQATFNKGMKWSEFMPKESQERCKRGQFKKGNIPHNWHPVGSERIDSEGYVWVKIREPNVWKQKSHLIWEAAHGQIPEGYAIVARDQNKQNCVLENLVLVSRNELKTMNQRYGLTTNPEVNQAILNASRIRIKLTEIKKGKKDEGSGSDN